jgi:HK97 family phage major capsid protein
MATLQDRARELEAKRAELNEINTKSKRADGTYDFDDATLAEVRGRTEELNKLTDSYLAAKAVEESARKAAEGENYGRPQFGNGYTGNTGTLGEMVVKSSAFTGYVGGQGPISTLDVDVKTVMSTSAGWDPEDLRRGKVLLSAQQQPRVMDLVPKTTTKMSTVKYMEETTHTNTASGVAEAGAYPEGALAFTEKSSEVRKIAVFLPVTDEMLEDTERVRDLIDNRLRFMIQRRLEQFILTGTGTAPELKGVANLSAILTQAKGTDPVMDAVYKAVTLIATSGFCEASAIVMHPNDWQDIRLTRTADGVYIMGNPDREVAPRLFGLPVITTTLQTENTAIVGDWQNHSELALRRGINVQISDSHDTYFTAGKKAIRADLRAALIFDRETGFCKVTGI